MLVPILLAIIGLIVGLGLGFMVTFNLCAILLVFFLGFQQSFFLQGFRFFICMRNDRLLQREQTLDRKDDSLEKREHSLEEKETKISARLVRDTAGFLPWLPTKLLSSRFPLLYLHA
jgi:ribonuclease Y